jgi:hypothetical protein
MEGIRFPASIVTIPLLPTPEIAASCFCERPAFSRASVNTAATILLYASGGVSATRRDYRLISVEGMSVLGHCNPLPAALEPLRLRTAMSVSTLASLRPFLNQALGPIGGPLAMWVGERAQETLVPEIAAFLKDPSAVVSRIGDVMVWNGSSG